MRVISIVNKRMKQYDKIREELLDDRLNVIRGLAYELIEYRKENEYSYKKQIFKLCRKKLIKRKVKTYNTIEKIANLVYMYILRRLGYYLKKVTNKNFEMPEGFYQGPAYLWEYSQELNWGGYWGNDIIENWNQYQEIFEYIEDEKSKSNLLNIMMARLTTDWKYYEACLEDREKEYFDKEIINLFGKQVIVDGGGYIGDTYHCFCKIWGEEYIRKWYLYEPDLKNIQEAQVLLKHEKNVILRPVGLAEKEGVANFLAKNSVASSCNKDGTESIKVVSLDMDIHEKITFIKLDIEGEELAALEGAKRHIAEEKPVLAVCLYHKKRDIPEIINYVKFLNPDYKLYIRHYSMAHWDTILYAIP